MLSSSLISDKFKATFLKPIDFSIWDLAEEKSYDAIIEHGKTKSPAWKFKVWVKKD